MNPQVLLELYNTRPGYFTEEEVDELEKLAKETEEKAGYDRVKTPHITKGSLYEKSGHLDHYRDAMYPSMDVDGTE